MRREVSQLHRCDCNGRDEVCTLKVWVAAPHKQETVSSREEGMIADKSVAKIMWETLSIWYIAACCLYVIIALKYKPDPARPRTTHFVRQSIYQIMSPAFMKWIKRRDSQLLREKRLSIVLLSKEIQQFVVFFGKNNCGMKHLWMFVL